jgi:hypothetical protein
VKNGGNTYSSLFLGRDFAHAQSPGEASEHFLARFKLRAGIAVFTHCSAEIALVRDWCSECPRNEIFVKERESSLLAPIRYNAIITSEISLSQSADVKVQLIQQSLDTMTIESCSMACVASKELICAETGEQDTGICRV